MRSVLPSQVCLSSLPYLPRSSPWLPRPRTSSARPPSWATSCGACRRPPTDYNMNGVRYFTWSCMIAYCILHIAPTIPYPFISRQYSIETSSIKFNFWGRVFFKIMFRAPLTSWARARQTGSTSCTWCRRSPGCPRWSTGLGSRAGSWSAHSSSNTLAESSLILYPLP